MQWRQWSMGGAKKVYIGGWLDKTLVLLGLRVNHKFQWQSENWSRKDGYVPAKPKLTRQDRLKTQNTPLLRVTRRKKRITDRKINKREIETTLGTKRTFRVFHGQSSNGLGKDLWCWNDPNYRSKVRQIPQWAKKAKTRLPKTVKTDLMTMLSVWAISFWNPDK